MNYKKNIFQYLTNLNHKNDINNIINEQFITDVKKPCGCLGIDITLALGHGLITFVMFSRNRSLKLYSGKCF